MRPQQHGHIYVKEAKIGALTRLNLSRGLCEGKASSDDSRATTEIQGRPVVIYTDLRAGANLSIIQLAEVKLTQ